MPPPPLPEPRPFWTLGSVAAVALAVLAVAAAAGGLFQATRATKLEHDLDAQALLANVYLQRSMDCMDLARAEMTGAADLARAEKMLNISKGITLCLVKARDDSVIDAEELSGCMIEIEAGNLIVDPESAEATTRPAC